ncbi:MAG: AEC family transporter [Candidatus Micrarchaeota archaeon]
MDFLALFGVVLPVFLLIALGFSFTRARLFREGDDRPLNDYAYYVAFPCLIFLSLATSKLDASYFASALVSVLAMLACAVLAFSVSRALGFGRVETGAVVASSFLGNVAYMGFPVVSMALGAGALPIAVFISAAYLIVALSLGVFILQHYSGAKINTKDAVLKIVLNPLLWGTLLGIIFSLADVAIPQLPASILSMIGASTSPVALFALGVFLSQCCVQLKPSRVAALSALKLLALPLLAFVFARALGLSGVPMRVVLLEAGMPLAVTNFVLAEQFKSDKTLIASATLATTLISLLTLSAMLLMF